MIKIFNVLNKGKLSLVRTTSICALSLVTVLASLSGCKSNEESAYIFDGVQATVDKDAGIYTITMSDGDVYHISREDLDSQYDFEYNPDIYEFWIPMELNDTSTQLDSISEITSDLQMKSATEDGDVVMVKRIG